MAKKPYNPHMAAPGLKPGAPVKTATGSKRIKPGDGSAPVGKRVKAYETMAMAAAKKKAADVQKNRFGRVLTPGDAQTIRRTKKKPLI
jgi:hypothetical protein